MVRVPYIISFTDNCSCETTYRRVLQWCWGKRYHFEPFYSFNLKLIMHTLSLFTFQQPSIPCQNHALASTKLSDYRIISPSLSMPSSPSRISLPPRRPSPPAVAFCPAAQTSWNLMLSSLAATTMHPSRTLLVEILLPS